MWYHHFLKPKAVVLVPMLLLLIVAIACGGGTATPIPTDTPAPTPVDTPTPEPGVTTVGPPPTATPTAAPRPPTATPVGGPTVTPLAQDPPTPTAVVPTPTPEPTPIPAFVGVQGGEFRHINACAPEHWDAHQAGTLCAQWGFSPLYNQVVEFNPIKPSEVIGDLAESWDVQDGGLTYIFKIHENVKWADGTDLTTEDVAFSINRMIETGPRPRTGLLRPSTKGAEVVDENTVKVTLKFPSASFLKFLAVDYMKVLPKHTLDAGVDLKLWENVNGSGPYLPDKFRRGDVWRHKKNPDYFKEGRPFFDTIESFFIRDPGTIAAAYTTGRVHIGGSLSIEATVKLGEQLQGKYTVFWRRNAGGQHFFGNVEKEPWKNLNIIKALRLATDLWEIREAFGQGQKPIGAPFAPGSFYGSSLEELVVRPGYGGWQDPPSPRTKQQDIDDAIALLKAEGFDPPSTLGKRVVLASTIGDWSDLTELWAQQMRRNLGLDMEVQVVDTPTAIGRMVAGDFDLANLGYAVNIADPDDWVTAIYGPGTRNFTRWKNPEFLEMLEQQAREQDVERRIEILRKMEGFLFEVEDPYVTTNWQTSGTFVNNKIRTEAGAYIVSDTAQTINKWEHLWLEE